MNPSTSETKPVERYHPRVETNLMVKLLVNGRAVLTRARDLSMAGLSLIGNFAFVRNQVMVAIPLPGDREIITRCAVRRNNGKTVALEFDQLDWEDMFALARFLHPRLP